MKLVLLLLVCCATVTLQQHNAYWYSPYSWLPYFYDGFFGGGHSPVAPANYYSPYVNRPVERITPQDLALLKLVADARKQKPLIASSAEGRIKILPAKNKNDKAEDRGFGGLKFFGLNALANYAVNSLTGYSSTSLRTTFITSTMTVGTVISCFTRTLFLSTTPCRRRKRKLLPGLLLGEDDHSDHSLIIPSQPESIEPSMELESANMRSDEGIDTGKALIESSIAEVREDESTPQGSAIQIRNIRNYFNQDSNEFLDKFEETLFVNQVTSTSFYVYTTTSTRTVVSLAAQSILSCLPACVILC